MKCLKCEKEMEPEEYCTDHQPNGGGELRARFNYGSRHDQGIGFVEPKNDKEDSNDPDKRVMAILGCTIVRAYICDECFKKNIHLFEGWKEEQKWSEEKIIPQA